MKISEVTTRELKDYCRVDWEEEDSLFNMILSAGKQFIQSQTGLAIAQMEEKEDLSIALLMICAEYYEVRGYTDNAAKIGKISPAADAIISQYRMNLL